MIDPRINYTKEQIQLIALFRKIVADAKRGDFTKGLEFGFNEENLGKLAAASETELEVLEEGVEVFFRDTDPKTGKLKPLKTH